jgi:hypothetical protein
MELKPWQEKIVHDMLQADVQKTLGGFKRGEMMIISAGRQTGKSYWTNQAIQRLMKDLAAQPIEQLVLSEGKVYGARYYAVQPIGGYWKDMEQWCTETFGPTEGSIWGESPVPVPGQRWYMNNRKFWFRSERDRTVFILRWSST